MISLRPGRGALGAGLEETQGCDGFQLRLLAPAELPRGRSALEAPGSLLKEARGGLGRRWAA